MTENNLPETVKDIYSFWQTVSENPGEWLQDIPGEIVFVAGGGLPLTFDNEESQIWKAIIRVAEDSNGFITIAGVSFALKELSLMGNFYRFVREAGYALHCIDERLVGSLSAVEKQVHEECGACAASHSVISYFLEDNKIVEDILLDELGEETFGKQSIYDAMPDHESLVVFIDFHGDEAIVDEDKRVELMNKKALPFQISLPIYIIKNFLKTRGDNKNEEEMLLNTLIKWNVQIARNIIGGDHNNLKEFADNSLFVIDQRSTGDKILVSRFREVISDVEHSREVIIKDKDV
jgi:hypothetical protein